MSADDSHNALETCVQGGHDAGATLGRKQRWQFLGLLSPTLYTYVPMDENGHCIDSVSLLVRSFCLSNGLFGCWYYDYMCVSKASGVRAVSFLHCCRYASEAARSPASLCDARTAPWST